MSTTTLERPYVVSELSPIQYKILNEIGTTLSKMGAKSDIMGTIMSWGDTLSDEDVAQYLKEANEKLIVKSEVDYEMGVIDAR